jgi:hypothetical protein
MRYWPPASFGLPPQPLHVVPAAQVSFLLPPQSIVHAVVPPHVRVQDALPSHAVVHPPPGQLTTHLLVPVQSIVEPAPSVTLHELPPAQSTVLFVPAL